MRRTLLRTTFPTLTTVLGGGAALLAAAYLYLMHTAPPEAPILSAPIRHGSIQVDSLQRTYRAFVPAGLPERPALLLAFHGSKGDGETMRVYTGYGFERLADRYGFIVVYPDGYARHWNDCRKSGPYAANTLDVDDPGFVRALIRRFAGRYGIDTTRVFAAGFSNGAHMAYRLALELPGSVRAIAAVGANLPAPENLDCTPSGAPVAVLIMNGTDDPLNPFEGGEVSLYGFLKRGTVRSARATAAYFGHLGGAGPVAPVLVPGITADEAVDGTSWASPGRPPVLLYAVRGGGHTFPQPHYRFPRLLGATQATLDGPAEIWAFFEHQMRGDPGEALTRQAERPGKPEPAG